MKPDDVFIEYDAGGKPRYFDVDHYLDSVEQMICADEIEMALYMLAHMPGYYRDFPPTRALEIREGIYRQTMNTREYVFDKGEQDLALEVDPCKVSLDVAWKYDFFHPRAHVMLELVKKINLSGEPADIYEMGPAYYWVPRMLKVEGCDFNYHPITMNALLKDFPIDIKPASKEGGVKIFACLEVIEHLFCPDDIYHEWIKSAKDSQHIVISTPKYCYKGGMPGWDKRELGHIRTYTPKEFVDFALKHWPEYQWSLNQSDEMMVVCGEKT